MHGTNLYTLLHVGWDGRRLYTNAHQGAAPAAAAAVAVMPIIFGMRIQHAKRVRSPIRRIRVIPSRCRSLIDDLEAHLAGRSGNDTEGGSVIAGVEVLALGVHDVHDLLARDFADFRFVRLFGTCGDVGRFL